MSELSDRDKRSPLDGFSESDSFYSCDRSSLCSSTDSEKSENEYDGMLPSISREDIDAAFHEIIDTLPFYSQPEPLTECQLDDVRELHFRLVDEEFSDETVERFYRACDRDIDAAYKKLTNANKWREENVDYFKASASHLVALRTTGYCTLWPHTDIWGRPVLWIRARQYNPNAISTDDLLMAFLFALETLAANHPGKQFVVIYDASNVSKRNVDLKPIPKILEIIQNIYPEKLGACFIMGANWAFKTAWAIVKPLMSLRTVQKIHILQDYENIMEILPSDRLPEEYGGSWSSSSDGHMNGDVEPILVRDVFEADWSDIEAHIVDLYGVNTPAHRLIQYWLHPSSMKLRMTPAEKIALLTGHNWPDVLDEVSL